MKTGQEYLLKFKTDEKLFGHENATRNLIKDLINEISELSHTQKHLNTKSIASILMEIDEKWRFICTKEISLNKEGFSILIKNSSGIDLCA